MAKEFPSVRPDILLGTSQALLEMKKMARSIEQSADALMPLADEPTTKKLAEVCSLAIEISGKVGSIYHMIAKEATEAR